MLGSPSFRSYRGANGDGGRPTLEMGSGLYYEDQSYSVRIIPFARFWLAVSAATENSAAILSCGPSCGGPASPVQLSPAHRCRMRRWPVHSASPANVNSRPSSMLCCPIAYMGN